MTDKLAPCPFCGSLHAHTETDGDAKLVYVICPNCGACGPAIAFDKLPKEMSSIAEAAWNTRKP